MINELNVIEFISFSNLSVVLGGNKNLIKKIFQDQLSFDVLDSMKILHYSSFFLLLCITRYKTNHKFIIVYL